MKVQLPVVTWAPDVNEVSVMVANTVVSSTAGAVDRSCGRFASVREGLASDVAEVRADDRTQNAGCQKL